MFPVCLPSVSDVPGFVGFGNVFRKQLLELSHHRACVQVVSSKGIAWCGPRAGSGENVSIAVAPTWQSHTTKTPSNDLRLSG